MTMFLEKLFEDCLLNYHVKKIKWLDHPDEQSKCGSGNNGIYFITLSLENDSSIYLKATFNDGKTHMKIGLYDNFDDAIKCCEKHNESLDN